MADSLGRDPARIERSTKDFKAGLPARRGAVALLDAVLRDRRPLDAAFAAAAAHGELARLAPRDRALARAIVATALRRKGQIEDIFHGLLERPMKGNTGSLTSIVLAAMAQLLFMGMSVHAVVNLAVEQCKASPRTRRYAGLVNAILRRVASSGPEIVSGQDAPRLNTPDWLWERWSAAYGGAAARNIAEAHLDEPPLDVSVTSDPETWAERLGGVVLATGSVRFRHKGRIEALAGFGEGRWWVQDAAAALPARLLRDIAGRRGADLCAAPGGKTMQLAAAGAKVVAVDSARARLGRLRDNLARLSFAADRVEADATQWTSPEPFDAVLLDPPCMATGTIRRHPDIPHVKRAAEIGELTALQARLLDHAITLVRPGGKLVYCTCSLEPEEGERQIARLLERAGHVARDPIRPDEVAGRADWLDAQGQLRTLPHYQDARDPEHGGMDGFFAARLTVGSRPASRTS